MQFFATNDKVKISGRNLYRDQVRYLSYSASHIAFTFTGKKASVHFVSDPQNFEEGQNAFVGIFVDDEPVPSRRICLTQASMDIVIYESEQIRTVTLTIMKLTVPEYASCGIGAITIDTDDLLDPPAARERRIQIIGDSITCGYGVNGSVTDEVHRTDVEDVTCAYSYLTARALDADYEIVAWNGKGVITSYVSVDTNPIDDSWLIPMLYEYADAGLSKQYFHEEQTDWQRWDFDTFVPDLVIIFLGTNDASYCTDHADRHQAFVDAYTQFVLRIHRQYPQARFLCTLGIMDQHLCPAVERIPSTVKALAPEVEIDYLHIPCQDEEHDGLGTFWHPSPSSHEKMARLITARAKDLMHWS